MNSLAANDFEFFIQKNLFKNGIEVGMILNSGGTRYVATPVCMTALTPEMEGMMLSPLLVMTKDSARNLMDELWNAGVRPSNEAGSVGELAAVKAHLKDMRELVAGFMELKK